MHQVIKRGSRGKTPNEQQKTNDKQRAHTAHPIPRTSTWALNQGCHGAAYHWATSFGQAEPSNRTRETYRGTRRHRKQAAARGKTLVSGELGDMVAREHFTDAALQTGSSSYRRVRERLRYLGGVASSRSSKQSAAEHVKRYGSLYSHPTHGRARLININRQFLHTTTRPSQTEDCWPVFARA